MEQNGRATIPRARSGRWVRGTVVGLALVGLSGSLAACGGVGGGDVDESLAIEATGPDASPSAALASAAAATSEVWSGRMSVTADYRFEVDGVTATATMEMEGVFSDQGRQSEITADMGPYLRQLSDQMGAPDDVELPGSMMMRMVVDGSLVYVKFDSEPAEPGMEHWYVTDMAEMGVDTSALESPGGLGGPTSYLESLKGAGTDVIDAGRTEIDGIPVRRYEGTVDPQTAIDRADPEKRSQLRSLLRQSGMDEPMPFVAFVDDAGILRRQEMTMSMETGGVAVTVTTTVDYYDFGAEVTVTTPPADLVRPASQLTGSGA
jgi:hypothetical protein